VKLPTTGYFWKLFGNQHTKGTDPGSLLITLRSVVRIISLLPPFIHYKDAIQFFTDHFVLDKKSKWAFSAQDDLPFARKT